MTYTRLSNDTPHLSMRPYRDSHLTRFLLTAFFLVAVGYGIFEGQAMLSGPRISLTPLPPSVSEPLLKLGGHADNIIELRMNGIPIAVTEQGDFSESYLLAPGYNRIVFDATDRWGRDAHEMTEVTYHPHDAAPASASEGKEDADLQKSATSTDPVSADTEEPESALLE